VTALIIAGVVLFLVVDAFIIYRVVIKRHKEADDFGSVPVPGEGTITLPAGRVKITYQESRHTSGGGEHDIAFDAPGELKVEITGGSSGAPLELKAPGFSGTGSTKSTGIGFSRDVLGTIEITEPGVYTVTAGPELPTAEQPVILLGK